MYCPHCNTQITRGISKCPYCTGDIGYVQVDSDTKVGAGKILGVIGAIGLPLLYHFVLDGKSIESYLIASAIGGALGFLSPWMMQIPERK